MRGARDARGAVHFQAKVFVSHQRCLPGVKPDADADAGSVWPRFPREHLLDRGRAFAGLERAVEDVEEGVALGPQFMAAVGSERLALDPVMGEQGFGILGAELLDQAGGAFDIAEKEGDRSGRQRAHAGAGAAASSGSRMAWSCPGYSPPRKSSRGCGSRRCSLRAPSFRR